MDDNLLQQGRINRARLVDQQRQRAKIARDVAKVAQYSPREHKPGEKSYVSPEEAIRALGLLRNQERLATDLVYKMIDGKSAYEAAREASDAGINRHAIREMISRTKRIIDESRNLQRPVLSPRNNGYAKSFAALDLVKAEKAPAGFVEFGSKIPGGARKPKGDGSYEYWYPGQGVSGKPHDDEHHDHHDAHRKDLERQLSAARAKSKPTPEVHAKFMEITDRAAEHGIRVGGKHPNGSHTLEDMERFERRLNRAIAKKQAGAESIDRNAPDQDRIRSASDDELKQRLDRIRMSPGFNPEADKREKQAIEAEQARRKGDASSPPTGEKREAGARPKGDNPGDVYDGLSPREQVRVIRESSAAFGAFIADMKTLGLETGSLEAAHKRLDTVLKRIGADSDDPVVKPSERETLKQLAGALRWMVIGMLTGFLAGGGHAGIAGLAAGSSKAMIDQKGIKQAHKQALQRFADHKEMHAASRQLLSEFEKRNAGEPEAVETDEDGAAEVAAPNPAPPESRPHFGDNPEAPPKNREQRRSEAAQARKKPKSKAVPDKAASKKRRKQQKASRRKNRSKKSLFIDMRTGLPVFASPDDLRKGLTPEDVHAAADAAGVEWDDNQAFMDRCENLVGKRHLDEMSGAELRIVANDLGKAENDKVSRKIKFLMEEEGKPQDQAVAIALDMERRGELSKAGPYIGPRGGKWADPEHTIPYKPTSGTKPRGKKKDAEDKPKRPPPASQLPPDVQAKLKALGVGKLPAADIPVEHIHTRLDGDPHETAVIKWRDAKGKLQSGYTPEFHARNAAKKWDRVMGFMKGFKTTQRNIHKALQQAEPGSREHQAALVSAIIAHTGLRPGSAASAKHGHYGVSTLTPAHVTIEGNKVSFEFVGKQGKVNTATIRNGAIAQALTPYIKGGNKRNQPMFASTVVADARKTLRAASGGDLKLKDMRTIKATQKAMQMLDSVVTPPPLTGNPAKDKRLLAKAMLEASSAVADLINNTPAVARSSYVHPQVFRQWAIDRAGADPKLFEEV